MESASGSLEEDRRNRKEGMENEIRKKQNRLTGRGGISAF